MAEYQPNVWILLKITTPDEILYKVLAGWYGGYTYGDSWKINSGITKYKEQDSSIEFHGNSGSVYICHKEVERTSMTTEQIFNNLKKIDKPGYSVEQISFEDFKKEFVGE